jgi:hypothetical protein
MAFESLPFTVASAQRPDNLRFSAIDAFCDLRVGVAE